jgi:hypothetical protein
MSITNTWFKPLFLGLAFVAASLYCRPMQAQSAPAIHVGGAEITGVPDDWSHHHVIFSNPGTEQEAIQGDHYEEWQKTVNDPRYVIQQLKKNLPVQGPAAADVEYRIQWISDADSDPARPGPTEASAPLFGFRWPHRGPIFPGRWPLRLPEVQRDWSMTSGGTGGLLPNHYPAKYSLLLTAASQSQASCSDFIVFPTGIIGSSTQATVVVYNNLYKTTCSTPNPGILLSINTGGMANTSPVLSLDGTQVAYIQSAATTSINITLTSSSKNFTVTTGTVSSSNVGNAIAGAGIPTGTSIATVTSSTAGTLNAAATASETKEAATIAGDASLVLVQIGSGGGSGVSSPLSPAAVSNASYRSCTAPCFTTFSLSGSRSDANSAPFYVYYDPTHGNTDYLYVGDDGGYVHEFTGVFLGTPAEVTTNWPVYTYSSSTETGGTVTNGTPALNSPVYDSTSGNIFVGDTSGYLHQFAVGTTPGTVNTSGHLEYGTNGMDSVIVDSSTDIAYQFVGYSDDTTDSRPSYINFFTTTSPISANSGFGTGVHYPNTSSTSRPAGTSTIQFTGTFDNTYFTGNGTTGNIYTCSDGVLYQIPLSTITSSTVNTFSTPTSAAAKCSPVSEFYNTTTSIDWIFMSAAANVTKSGGNTTCTGACVLNYNVTTSSNTTGTPTAGLAETGGTSGIVIDNAASGGGSEIYFTSLGGSTCAGNGTTGSGTGSCAVQATQAGLQ